MHGFLFGSTYTTCSAAFVFFVVSPTPRLLYTSANLSKEVVPCKGNVPGYLLSFMIFYEILAGLSKSLPYIVTFHLIYRNHIHSYQVYHISSFIFHQSLTGLCLHVFSVNNKMVIPTHLRHKGHVVAVEVRRQKDV